MTDFEIYKEHIQHTHNAFCRIVIRHAAIDAARSIRSRRSREISLDYLIDEKHYPFSTTDEYFAEPPTSGEYPFTACGQTVLIENSSLAAALSSLSEMEQEMIFLYYFQRLTHKEIGKQYGRSRSTTGRRIQIILQQLRAELEGVHHEPATPL
uniref:RNA polymerase sigma factor n=1 Tax=Agathobacter sp. TaxID=2021311 RepID=UPI004056DBFD